VVGPVLGGLSGNGLPGSAAVVTAVDAGLAHHRDAREKRLAGLALGAASGIEDHKDDAAAASAAPGGQLGFFGRQFQDIGGKAVHLVPGHSAVRALPQATVARAQKKDAAVVGVHSHALAIATTGFVAAELDGHVAALEGVALVRRPQDRAVGNFRSRVGAAGQVDLAGIRGIHGDALDAHEVQILVRNPIEHRFPAPGLGIPAIGAAHVRAGVQDIFGGGMEHEPIHESASHDLHALPGVWDCLGFLSGGRWKGEQK
jgi:hypothetical protein